MDSFNQSKPHNQINNTNNLHGIIQNQYTPQKNPNLNELGKSPSLRSPNQNINNNFNQGFVAQKNIINAMQNNQMNFQSAAPIPYNYKNVFGESDHKQFKNQRKINLFTMNNQNKYGILIDFQHRKKFNEINDFSEIEKYFNSYHGNGKLCLCEDIVTNIEKNFNTKVVTESISFMSIMPSENIKMQFNKKEKEFSKIKNPQQEKKYDKTQKEDKNENSKTSTLIPKYTKQEVKNN